MANLKMIWEENFYILQVVSSNLKVWNYVFGLEELQQVRRIQSLFVT